MLPKLSENPKNELVKRNGELCLVLQTLMQTHAQKDDI